MKQVGLGYWELCVQEILNNIKALVQAELNVTYKQIRIATYGIAFFATPHQGGNHVRLGEVVSTIARAVLRNPKNTFLEALKRNSAFADSLTQHFRHQLEDYYILSFFETRPLGKLGIVRSTHSITGYVTNLQDANLSRLLTGKRRLLGCQDHGKDRSEYTPTIGTSAGSIGRIMMSMSK